MIEQVNSGQQIIDYWTFGGGTAMMLQINHRESNDVDIFLPDAQLLSFLDPQKRDFDFEIRPSDYNGDGSRFLKLGFEIGEIDFIVARALTSSPTTQAADARTTMALRVYNLFDTIYATGGPTTQWLLGMPRTAELSLNVKF